MIGSSENRVSYNGNGIATEFAYNFIILEKTDIKVLHVAKDGTETLLVSDYYVDMEKSVVLYPGYAPGAEIPEQNRPPILPVGERLVIYREVPITQESALDKHWPFNVVENGLDKLTIICQQMWDRLTRSFYVSEATSTNFDTKIPIEAGKTFRVKDDGTGFEVTEDPVRAQQVAVSAKNDAEKARDAAKLARDTARAWAEENAGTTPSLIGGAKSSKQWSEHIHGYVDTAVEDARIAKETAIKSSEFVGNIVSGELYNIYSSVADMKADTTLMAGQTVKTVGYYKVNDGGGAFYYIRAKLTDDVDDGGSLHDLANGLVAELIVESGTICPEQFGAKGDGINDDTQAIQSAFNSSGCVVVFTHNKEYCVSSNINISKNIIIYGNNALVKALDYQLTGIEQSYMFYVTAETTIYDLMFDGNKNENNTRLIAIFSYHTRLIMHNLVFKNCAYHHIVVYGGECIGENITFHDLGMIGGYSDVFVSDDAITNWRNIKSFREYDYNNTGQIFYLANGKHWIDTIYCENVSAPFDLRAGYLNVRNVHAIKPGILLVIVYPNNEDVESYPVIEAENLNFENMKLRNLDVNQIGFISITACKSCYFNNVKISVDDNEDENMALLSQIAVRNKSSLIRDVVFKNVTIKSTKKPKNFCMFESIVSTLIFENCNFESIDTTINPNKWLFSLYTSTDYNLIFKNCKMGENSNIYGYDYTNKAVSKNARFITDTKTIGTTNERPLLTAYETKQYYDTDLSKFVLWNGSTWVDI